MKINYLEHHGVKGMKWGVRRKRVANHGLSDFKMSTKKSNAWEHAIDAIHVAFENW